MKRRPTKTPFVRVSPRLKKLLQQGHPWIYADAIERAGTDLVSGTWVRVQCANLQYFGLWQEDNPIAIRLFSRHQIPDRKWVHERIHAAWERRAPLREPESRTTAYRWINGAGDGLPGLVVDLYEDTHKAETWAVLRAYASSLNVVIPWVVAAIQDVIPLRGVVQRDAGPPLETHLLAGTMPSADITIRENDLRFAVNILTGQKTGFFLDQRDNRRTVGQRSQGRQVLNLFSYTGGFSVYAARGGAQQVTSVDSAGPAMAVAEYNFQVNGLDPQKHSFVIADCFEILSRYHGQGRRFDLIVVDPPSFARSQAQLPAALKAYRQLNRLATECLTPHGLLATASCTAQVSPVMFQQMLAQAAADADRRLIILHEAGHPLDHPIPVGFPEGRYLKFILAQADP